MYPLLRPLLFRMEAEQAHHLTLKSLACLHHSRLLPLFIPKPGKTPVNAFGISFPNPVGLAAGLDKNGQYIDALGALGFGFIEIGTVTPRPQTGNPQPRLFRLPEHQAIINRMGFNNDGVDALVANVERSHWQGVLGINIGRNKHTANEDAINDYLICLERVYPLASYITVNISSPNTKGLRDLQQGNSLKRLINTLQEHQAKLATKHGRYKPLLIKIAPDLDAAQLDNMAAVFQQTQIDGIICTNTTISRTTVQGHHHAQQTGGLSGGVLFDASTAILKALDARLEGRIPIIGVGGITSSTQAEAKIQAGASLVQLYSGLIYRGPKLIHECAHRLHQALGETSV